MRVLFRRFWEACAPFFISRRRSASRKLAMHDLLRRLRRDPFHLTKEKTLITRMHHIMKSMRLLSVRGLRGIPPRLAYTFLRFDVLERQPSSGNGRGRAWLLMRFHNVIHEDSSLHSPPPPLNSPARPVPVPHDRSNASRASCPSPGPPAL